MLGKTASNLNKFTVGNLPDVIHISISSFLALSDNTGWCLFFETHLRKILTQIIWLFDNWQHANINNSMWYRTTLFQQDHARFRYSSNGRKQNQYANHIALNWMKAVEKRYVFYWSLLQNSCEKWLAASLLIFRL